MRTLFITFATLWSIQTSTAGVAVPSSNLPISNACTYNDPARLWPATGTQDFDVYIDDSITNDAVFGPDGLTGQHARDIIEATFQQVRSETGADIRFNFLGAAGDRVCPNATPYANKTIIVRQSVVCYRCEGSSACADFQFELGNCANLTLIDHPTCTDYVGIAHPWQAYSSLDETQNDLVSVIKHELGHIMGFDHPDQNGCDNPSDRTVMAASFAPGRELTFQDKRGYREMWGYGSQRLHYYYQTTWPPTSWWANSAGVSDVTSPAAFASTENDTRATLYLGPNPGSMSSTIRGLFKDGAWHAESIPWVGTPVHPPDVAQSSGHLVDKWMVAGYWGDTNTNEDKGIHVVERDLGNAPGGWLGSLVVDEDTGLLFQTQANNITLAHDRKSDRFVMALDANDAGRNLSFLTREFQDTQVWDWKVTHTDIETAAGASVACEYSVASRNCVVTYSDVDNAGTVMWQRFRIQADGSLDLENVAREVVGAESYLKTSVVAQNVTGNGPRYLVSLIPRNWPGLSYLDTYKKDSDTDLTWTLNDYQGVANNPHWYRGTALGLRTTGPTSYMYLTKP